MKTWTLGILLSFSQAWAGGYTNYPGAGDGHWKSPTTNVAALPASGNTTGDARTALDTFLVYVWNGSSWVTASGGGSGTVTSASVVSANGFAGTVATASTTPAITLSTSITGMLKGNGTAISAGTSGTDYSAGTSGLATGILKSTTTTGALTTAIGADFPTLNQNTSGTAANVTGSTNSTLTTLSALSLPATQLSGTLAAGQFPALTGDITTSAGALATTLATVNGNVGSFGSTTAIPNITVNGKGLLTAASTSAVVAPAGTLSGTTLNSPVVSSSLTSVGTITTGTWTGTTIAVANGGTAQTAVISAPAATTWAGWDANKNLSANNHIQGYTTTATAAGTTTLVVGSNFQQYFTGVTTQTVKLPVTSTLVLGQQFQIINKSTGNVTVQSSGANSILVMAGSTVATFTCILVTGTTAASWSSGVASTNFVPAYFASTAITTLSTVITSASFATFSNSPALTFTPTVTGTYKVYSNAIFEADGGSTNSVAQVINTTGGATLLNASQGNVYDGSSSVIIGAFIQSVYTLTAGVSYVFDIQGKTASGSLFLNGGNGSFNMFAERIQ